MTARRRQPRTGSAPPESPPEGGAHPPVPVLGHSVGEQAMFLAPGLIVALSGIGIVLLWVGSYSAGPGWRFAGAGGGARKRRVPGPGTRDGSTADSGPGGRVEKARVT
jgi:hypothetical protein